MSTSSNDSRMTPYQETAGGRLQAALSRQGLTSTARDVAGGCWAVFVDLADGASIGIADDARIHHLPSEHTAWTAVLYTSPDGVFSGERAEILYDGAPGRAFDIDTAHCLHALAQFLTARDLRADTDSHDDNAPVIPSIPGPRRSVEPLRFPAQRTTDRK
ncbi:hypothetical protein QMK19_29035 [Streptomyces sp. H10-C2]|uniref:hypothetical protein n=1 Tax=Streptomyces TaxID=1883 RepID=UPI0018DFE930|nr:MULTISPECIES: hypothetical protein [Streptomyces]MDJ0344256.1 hypothetical protein [Streptomyces sp. PH10-H1]MDJ0373594.1 hypothetical protein [Streptomyces sp. H10-C2]